MERSMVRAGPGPSLACRILHLWAPAGRGEEMKAPLVLPGDLREELLLEWLKAGG